MDTIETRTKRYDELSDEEKEIFKQEVGDLCSKSVNIYNLLIEQIHRYKTPLPVVGNIMSSVTEEGDKIFYKGD